MPDTVFDRVCNIFDRYENGMFDEFTLQFMIISSITYKRKLITRELPSHTNIVIIMRIVIDACYRYGIPKGCNDSILISLARNIVNMDSQYAHAASSLILSTIRCSSHNIRNLQRTYSNELLHHLISDEYLVPCSSLRRQMYKQSRLTYTIMH